MVCKIINDYRQSSIAQRKNESSTAMIEFAQRFVDQDFYLPQIDPDKLPEGQFGLQLVGFSSDDKKLFATCDASSSKKLLTHSNGGVVYKGDGSLIVGMAAHERFTLSIIDAENDDIHEITANELLLIRDLLFLSIGTQDFQLETSETTPFLHLKPFTDWLYKYCLSQPDISKAWIGLLNLGQQIYSKSNLCVIFESTDASTVFDSFSLTLHDEQAQQHSYLLPGGIMVMSKDNLLSFDSNKGFGDVKIISAICDKEPFFDRNHKQNWWNRLHRHIRPNPICFVNANIGVLK